MGPAVTCHSGICPYGKMSSHRTMPAVSRYQAFPIHPAPAAASAMRVLQPSVVGTRQVICSAAGSADDWNGASGSDEMYKLQQELLQEVAERKRLATKLIQRLRTEASEGRVCLVDDKKDAPAAPFSSEQDSKNPTVTAFVDAPAKERTSTGTQKAAPQVTPPSPGTSPQQTKAPQAGAAPPQANKAPFPPSKIPSGSALPPVGSPPTVTGAPKTVAGPSSVAAPGKKTLPPVGAPPGTPAKVPTPTVKKLPGSLEFPPAKEDSVKTPVAGKTTTAEDVPKKDTVQAGPKTAGKAPVEPADVPLAGENVMKVVMVGAECTPWSKTGGLGDVMGALPKALAARGHRTMVVVPRYDDYYSVKDTKTVVRFRVFNSEHEVRYYHLYKDGVDYVFVDHASFHGRGKEIYGGSRLDIAFRCALLCKAALEAPWHVACGGVPYGDDNLLFIANDWHTALLPVYLEAHYRQYSQMTYARSMLVIHNMAHQGRGPFAELDNFEIPNEYRHTFFLDDPIGGEHMNIMKAGIMAAHRLVAVSHGYAWECQTQEGGWGLDSFLREVSWKFRGIVNGVDLEEWDPATDAYLKEDGYANYTLETMEAGKAKNKMALQKELGLPINPDVPLIGFIGRLDYQKGVDIIRDSYDWIMSQGCQMILLGSGNEALENDLREMENKNPQQCKAWVGFNVSIAHRITAGCDLLLMPSRFEPCGLNQLYAMHYGTPPIVHAVGGLRDTVKPYDPFQNTGTGWTFDRAESEPLKQAMHNALETYKYHKESFKDIQVRGMELDLSWDKAAEEYEEVMVAAKYQW